MVDLASRPAVFSGLVGFFASGDDARENAHFSHQKMEGKSRSDSFALASSHFLGDFAVLPAVGVVFRPRVADRTVGCSFRCPVSCALLLGGGSQWRFE